jgi:hypothetical protein
MTGLILVLLLIGIGVLCVIVAAALFVAPALADQVEMLLP